MGTIKKFMKKEFLLVFLIICSCNSYKRIETLKQVAKKDYSGLKYKFSDSGNRNINITFNCDSTITVTNRTNIAQNYHLFYFNCIYFYKIIDVSSINIIKTITCDKSLKKNNYIKPYNNKQYSLDKNTIDYIFPDLFGDTIRFSADFQKLQVREFCFERVKN